MPKINVYLPDDLAEAVRDADLPVSAICQRALDDAVRRVAAIRQVVSGELDPEALPKLLPQVTARTIAVLTGAIGAAHRTVTTGDLLRATVAEGQNLALQVLTAMEVPPAALVVPQEAEAGPEGGFSEAAAKALTLAVTEAAAFGHNYVGCEHLLIGLAAEQTGTAGRVLRERGADEKATRRAVGAALAGYAHLRAASAPSAPSLLAAVRAELAPLVSRIEALEQRRG